MGRSIDVHTLPLWQKEKGWKRWGESTHWKILLSEGQAPSKMAVLGEILPLQRRVRAGLPISS